LLSFDVENSADESILYDMLASLVEQNTIADDNIAHHRVNTLLLVTDSGGDEDEDVDEEKEAGVSQRLPIEDIRNALSSRLEIVNSPLRCIVVSARQFASEWKRFATILWTKRRTKPRWFGVPVSSPHLMNDEQVTAYLDDLKSMSFTSYTEKEKFGRAMPKLMEPLQHHSATTSKREDQARGTVAPLLFARTYDSVIFDVDQLLTTDTSGFGASLLQAADFIFARRRIVVQRQEFSADILSHSVLAFQTYSPDTSIRSLAKTSEQFVERSIYCHDHTFFIDTVDELASDANSDQTILEGTTLSSEAHSGQSTAAMTSVQQDASTAASSSSSLLSTSTSAEVEGTEEHSIEKYILSTHHPTMDPWLQDTSQLHISYVFYPVSQKEYDLAEQQLMANCGNVELAATAASRIDLTDYQRVTTTDPQASLSKMDAYKTIVSTLQGVVTTDSTADTALKGRQSKTRPASSLRRRTSSSSSSSSSIASPTHQRELYLFLAGNATEADRTAVADLYTNSTGVLCGAKELVTLQKKPSTVEITIVVLSAAVITAGDRRALYKLLSASCDQTNVHRTVGVHVVWLAAYDSPDMHAARIYSRFVQHRIEYKKYSYKPPPLVSATLQKRLRKRERVTTSSTHPFTFPCNGLPNPDHAPTSPGLLVVWRRKNLSDRFHASPQAIAHPVTLSAVTPKSDEAKKAPRRRVRRRSNSDKRTRETDLSQVISSTVYRLDKARDHVTDRETVFFHYKVYYVYENSPDDQLVDSDDDDDCVQMEVDDNRSGESSISIPHRIRFADKRTLQIQESGNTVDLIACVRHLLKTYRHAVPLFQQQLILDEYRNQTKQTWYRQFIYDRARYDCDRAILFHNFGRARAVNTKTDRALSVKSLRAQASTLQEMLDAMHSQLQKHADLCAEKNVCTQTRLMLILSNAITQQTLSTTTTENSKTSSGNQIDDVPCTFVTGTEPHKAKIDVRAGKEAKYLAPLGQISVRFFFDIELTALFCEHVCFVKDAPIARDPEHLAAIDRQLSDLIEIAKHQQTQLDDLTADSDSEQSYTSMLHDSSNNSALHRLLARNVTACLLACSLPNGTRFNYRYEEHDGTSQLKSCHSVVRYDSAAGGSFLFVVGDFVVAMFGEQGPTFLLEYTRQRLHYHNEQISSSSSSSTTASTSSSTQQCTAPVALQLLTPEHCRAVLHTSEFHKKVIVDTFPL